MITEKLKLDTDNIATLLSGGAVIVVGKKANVEITLEKNDLTIREKMDSVLDSLEWDGVEID